MTLAHGALNGMKSIVNRRSRPEFEQITFRPFAQLALNPLSQLALTLDTAVHVPDGSMANRDV